MSHYQPLLLHSPKLVPSMSSVISSNDYKALMASKLTTVTSKNQPQYQTLFISGVAPTLIKIYLYHTTFLKLLLIFWSPAKVLCYNFISVNRTYMCKNFVEVFKTMNILKKLWGHKKCLEYFTM